MTKTLRRGIHYAMKALALNGYGLDNVVVTDIADPEPRPDEVVVRVLGAALNHLDLWTLSGSLKIAHEFPHVLGADGAGAIEAVGEGVRGISRGDRVIVNPGLSCGACELCRSGEQSMCTTFKLLGEHVPGTFADKVRVPARNVFPAPGHLSFTEAAALGITFITAYRMLFTRGGLRPGEWVLITGIGGGLALSLFQLARPLAGKILVTSSSDDKIARAVELGADGGVNYTQEDVGKAIRGMTAKRGVDLVVDSAGGETLDASLRACRRGGRVVIAGSTTGGKAEIGLDRLFWTQLSLLGSTMGSDRDVADMLRLVAGTKLRPIIDGSYPLEQGVAALRRLETQDQFGKIVLDVAPSGTA